GRVHEQRAGDVRRVAARVAALVARERQRRRRRHARAHEAALAVDLEDLVDEDGVGAVGAIGDEVGVERHVGPHNSAMSPDLLAPATRAWFEATFAAPTRAQVEGWPRIASGAHALLAAPTGSGKTLAAFLMAIDRLVREPAAATPGVRVLYVS